MKLAEQLIGMPRHLSQHVGGFILTERPLTETVPIGNGAMDGPHLHRMGQGRHRGARHPQDRRARARHADLHPQMLRPDRAASWRALRAGDRPAGGAGGLRHAVQGGLARRVPGRKPGADEHAAAPEAAQVLRPGHRGRDRPAGADPGRHGPSLSEAPRGQGAGDLPLPRSRAWPAGRAGEDPRADARACRSSRSRR